MSYSELSSSSSASAVVALGSNLGESFSTLSLALQTLDQTPGITLVKSSNWYRTKPVGPPQPDYLNGCALLAVTLTPHQLLQTLLATETQFGRIRQQRWGARTLDLDVILFDDLILETPDLTIPHPRMAERAFVLVPMVDIVPERVDPVSGQTIQQLLTQVDCSDIHLFSPD